MRIETLSIRAVTVSIFLMIGMVAMILSLLAGGYFRQAALDAQMNSLSRVIEVASQEMLKKVRGYTFDLGMRLGHNREVAAIIQSKEPGQDRERLVALLDDPFINGFVGFAEINLEKIRVFDNKLQLVGESSKGLANLPEQLTDYLQEAIASRSGVERLKAVDALWRSSAGTLHSTLVPIGGLRLMGYVEIIINPVYNLPDIGKITKTPISIYSINDELIIQTEEEMSNGYLPVEYLMQDSSGLPAFKIIGYENVLRLNQEMKRTQVVVTSAFLLLTLVTLVFALWLFNRFLFMPFRRMMLDMQKIAKGELDISIDRRGLRDFSILAESFDDMANQLRMRTNDLEQLLDLDESAIFCFDRDGDVIYLNARAKEWFGYQMDEVADLDINDLFAETLDDVYKSDNKIKAQLTGKHKNGVQDFYDAIIRPLSGAGGEEFAVILNRNEKADALPLSEEVLNTFRKSEQRINVVEQSLNALLTLAEKSPGLISNTAHPELTNVAHQEADTQKQRIREQAVNLMNHSLLIWERVTQKNKLDLAEESGIWPVYIDKSTPTTRTLDKYLNVETCPKNPRVQRVIDTAEFVLKNIGDGHAEDSGKLLEEIDGFRLLVSGIKS